MTCPIGTDVSKAATILREGGLVAFATETVYGLGGNALDPTAVARIFEAKQRPEFDPLIVHFAERSWLHRLTMHIPSSARMLMDAFWPGPLTFVLPKAEIVPDLVTSGLPTVAVRMPAHPQAQELMRLADVPVAAPSANLFGRLSPTCAQHVAEQLSDRIDYILDGGPSTVGVESSVLQWNKDAAVLLRPGGLSVEDIEAVIGPVMIPSEADHPVAQSSPSPGMLPQHYAPQTPLFLQDAGSPLPEGSRLGLVCLQTPADTASSFACVEVLSPTGDLVEAATRFFAALRRLDACGLDAIVAHPLPETGLGRALNDRLRRATYQL